MLNMRKKKIKLARIEISNIDDPFLRLSLVLYVCGCWHKCKNCQNKELQNPDSKLCKEYSLEEVKKKIEDVSNVVESVVYLGGDFGYSLEEYLEISQFAKSEGLYNVLYTGFLIEDIPCFYLKYTDVVIDGKYNEKKKQDKFPASSNQRVWVFNTKINDFILADIDYLPINKTLN